MILFNKNMLGGLAGAVTLNIIHQTAKQLDPDAPEIDRIGQEALSKTLRASGYEPPEGNRLFLAALGSDIAANAAYFSLIGIGSRKHLLMRGALFGVAAGLGTLKLTAPAGLDDAPVKKSRRTEVMTIAWYLAAGLVTAGILKAIKKRRV